MSHKNIFLYSSHTTHSTWTSSMDSTFVALSLLPSGVIQTLISKRDDHWLWSLFKPLLPQLPIIGYGQGNHSRFSYFQIYTYWSSLCSINPISYDSTSHFPYQYSMPGEYCYLCLPVSCEALSVSLEKCLFMVEEPSCMPEAGFWMINTSLLQRTWSWTSNVGVSAVKFLDFSLEKFSEMTLAVLILSHVIWSKAWICAEFSLALFSTL